MTNRSLLSLASRNPKRETKWAAAFRQLPLANCRVLSTKRWWPGLTFGDILDKAADVYPEKEAIVDDTKRLTYAELREKTDRLAIGLMDLDIQPLDRVLLQLPNWHEFVAAYFALQKIGAIPVILIARYRQYGINHLARLSDAAA